MKTVIFISALMMSFASMSEELPEADAEVIQELKDFCMEIATEEGTGDMTMEQFLLSCVNQELEGEGYQHLKTLSE